MKKIWFALLVAAGIAFVLGATCVSRYNRLVGQEEGIDGAWAQVENVLQRRADLVPNLVETVKGYAAHEREVFKEVADARSRLLAAHGPAEAGEANQGLGAALGRLLALSERYPDLKANQNFLNLQDELAGTENRIAVERRRYNEAVRMYNANIRTFPTNLWASMFGFESRQYFEATEGAGKAPSVDFTPLGAGSGS
jgi:LemA protein